MAEGRIAKPDLRNLHMKTGRSNLILAVSSSIAVGLLYKFLVSDVYERRAVEFYKKYDAMASLKKMNDAGLMESAP